MVALVENSKIAGMTDYPSCESLYVFKKNSTVPCMIDYTTFSMSGKVERS